MVRAIDIAETRSRSWCQRKETDERIPAILQRSGRRRGMSSLGSIRSVYAVEDLPKSWTISCRSGRVENHWMTGTCRAYAGHAIQGSRSRTGRGTEGRSTPIDLRHSSRMRFIFSLMVSITLCMPVGQPMWAFLQRYSRVNGWHDS